MNEKNEDESKVTIEYIREIQVQAIEKYQKLARETDKDTARKETVKWLNGKEKIKEAGISIDGETIWIIFLNGVELDVVAK